MYQMRASVTHQRFASACSSGGGSMYSSEIGGSRSHDSASSVEAFEDDHIFVAESSNFECGSFATRSPLKLINDVVSKLCHEKRELVNSTGFGGILHFPAMKQINRKFALWLMSCVDESTRTLVVADHIRIRFCKEDVGNVFGIPTSGKRVIDQVSCGRTAKDKVLDDYLGPNFRKQRSIKELVDVIVRHYESPMSKAEQDRFRIAFVVFVASTLLSPSAKHDYACIDYWTAIQDADCIGDYDWSEFVIIRLVEAVSKLKQDISSTVKFPNITGCSVFIQVLYLDSLDLGEHTILENSTPRIRHFTLEKIRAMIGADNNYANYVKGNKVAPATELRKGSGCCYYWSFEALAPSEVPRSGSLMAIWESCVAMARFLEIPMEAAGPLFVAAADFQDQVDAGVARSGVHAIKYLSVLVSIMSAFKEGFTYHVSIGDDQVDKGNFQVADHLSSVIAGGFRMLAEPVCRKRKFANPSPMHPSIGYNSSSSAVFAEPSSSAGVSRNLLHSHIGDSVQSSIKAAVASLDLIRPELNVNHRLITSMSKFYSLVGRMKVPVHFDMNQHVPEYFVCSHGLPSTTSHLVGEVPSPWALGYSWSTDELIGSDALCRIRDVRDEEGFVIVHRNPRHIQVTARGLRSQILGTCEMEHDLFDAIIRKVKQEDSDLYSNVSCVRWRHFFESDFMAIITSGSFDLSDSKLLEHFSRCNMSFDLSACKILFFPAMLHYRWVCYAWCLDENVIHVFDPCFTGSAPESVLSSHEHICFLLKCAMHSLTRSMFESWKFKWVDAELRFVAWIDKTLKRTNRSGVLSALFCRCFDGQALNPPPSNSVSTDVIAAKHMYDIVSLKGNIGQIPASLV